jgi:hypothetical protein
MGQGDKMVREMVQEKMVHGEMAQESERVEVEMVQVEHDPR